MACKQISYLEIPTRKVGLKNPYLICNYCGGSHEAEECRQNNSVEKVVRSKFKGELANFTLEKKFHTEGIGEMLDQHHKGMHEQFSQILSIIGKSKIPEPEAPTFAITTRYGISTRDPPFPAPSQSTPSTTLNGRLKKKDQRV
ncbi:hypothetical protein Tco_1384499 [Tanacetum coccineum]